MSNRLAELHPKFFVTPWIGMPALTTPEQMLDQRIGMGLQFDCPGHPDVRVLVVFLNPLDGGPPASQQFPTWSRVMMSEDTWDGLSLDPFDVERLGRGSIHR